MKRIIIIMFATLLVLLGAGCGIEKNKSFTPLDETSHPFFGVPASTNHVDWLKTNGYNIKQCKVCHGDQLDGGTSGVSCAQCHHDANGRNTVADCNHCHGTMGAGVDVTNPFNWAPPRALNGDTAHTSRGVGRHQFHMRTTGSFELPIACAGCHVVPATWDADTHLNGVVNMSSLVDYDPNTKTCSACHGRSNHTWNQQ
jgi:hypothetical protein